jgi:hypothetical protein
MSEKASGTDSFIWWFTLCVAGCFALTFFPLTISSSDFSAIFYLVVTAPLVSLILLGTVYKRRGKLRLTALAVLAVFVTFTAILVTRFLDTRDAARWLVHGKAFKAEILAQPDESPKSLRHMEWEGWGFPGAGNTVVYLVFDPSDSLAAAAKSGTSGKFESLPCTVVRVRKRERQWYTVLFYTDSDWEHCAD